MSDQYEYLRGPKPDKWFYPNDRAKSDKHNQWSRAKAQANFRNEGWHITEEDWMNILWPDHMWGRRGRQGTDLCMLRIDSAKPWTIKNTQITTRRLQLILQKHPRKNLEIAEVEPGIWDIVGKTLEKHLKSRAVMSKYYEKYKLERKNGTHRSSKEN